MAQFVIEAIDRSRLTLGPAEAIARIEDEERNFHHRVNSDGTIDSIVYAAFYRCESRLDLTSGNLRLLTGATIKSLSSYKEPRRSSTGALDGPDEAQFVAFSSGPLSAETRILSGMVAAGRCAE